MGFKTQWIKKILYWTVKYKINNLGDKHKINSLESCLNPKIKGMKKI